ncbi:hypothetical protein H2203_001636 [Taxawa tesnikishii (nom. ined.)]|nr:hypothetical protein H2203_001636 [Dothideales sp. JES 119]
MQDYLEHLFAMGYVGRKFHSMGGVIALELQVRRGARAPLAGCAKQTLGRHQRPLNAARQFVRNLHTLTSQVRSWLVALIELLFTLTIGFALLLFAILVHAIIEGVKSIFSVWDAFVAGYHSFVGVWADAWQQFRNAPLTQPDDLNKRFIGIWKDLVRHELIGLGLAGSWAGYPRGRQSSADEDAASTADEREPATLTDEADAVPGDNEPEAAVDAAVDTAETPNPTFEDTPPHPAVSTRPVTEVANTADDTMVLAGAAESAGSAALTEDTDPGAFVQTRFKDSIFDASRAAGPGLLTPDVTPLPQCHNELAPATPVSPTTRVPRSQDDENEDRTF